ncbi:GNAT family N-acetyltransferase [Psychrobacter sp. I-STPA10]|uniref:GNAT family N-acetyltransferase n=1 Tax=Psychrobacter sp. I-STPA10 TaxID=2585769 RepID=UPI001E46B989|nr:GNAT family N-acetyltransferase [Psychrobacter sp. I-STPA10]
MPTSTLTYSLTQDTHWQTQTNWQTPDTPFMRFEFWQALQDTGAIGEQAGWLTVYIVIHKQSSSEQNMPESPLAVMPLFIKDHHQGEFVFDQTWAEAYARYGVDYYPRLVTSVPYTPVTGQRLWLANNVTLSSDILAAALAGVDAVAKQVNASSWHGLFMTQDMVDTAEQTLSISQPSQSSSPSALLQRQGCQFIWHNGGCNQPQPMFADFEEFLATLTAKKRKNMRQERKKIAKQGIRCRLKTGTEINQTDWDIFYQCYAMTYAVRGRAPYLTPEFFVQIAQTMPQHLMLAQAITESDEVVASSLFFYDDPNSPNATLYGRYWGALAEYDSLHFELCYYQGIEFAIAQGLRYFDPGTQGEHKLIRGFVPSKTYSLHRIYNDGFAAAISNFCQQERDYMAAYRQQAHDALPFNIDNMPAFQG